MEQPHGAPYIHGMTRILWLLASLVGAVGWAVIALHRGEQRYAVLP